MILTTLVGALALLCFVVLMMVVGKVASFLAGFRGHPDLLGDLGVGLLLTSMMGVVVATCYLVGSLIVR